METQRDAPSEVYKRASLATLRYFYIAYVDRTSILSVLRRENNEFRTMLKVLEEGTGHATYLESIVKPLEEAGLLSCDHVGGYCMPTYKGKNALNKFNNAANNLDKILGGIDQAVSRYFDLPGMEAFDKIYILHRKLYDDICIIQKSTDCLENFISSKGPFKPKGNINPYIEAFIRAKGEPHDFILQIASLYHPLAFLLTAKYIIGGERYYKDGYPTGKKIKKMLEKYTERYDIPEPVSPLLAFSAFLPRLIDNRNRYRLINNRSNRYRLTDYGEYLAKYIALHILLS